MLTKSKDETNGKMEAELVEIRAKNECNMKIAAKMKQLADINCQTIDVTASGESQVSKVMAARRKYEHLAAKTKVLSMFK